MSIKGAMLVNLGSPDSTEVKDVRKYLGEFLMDKYVIDVPFWLRYILVKGIILNTRPKKSAKAYRKIWFKEGSPLIVLSKKLLKKIQQKTQLPVELAMRYGNPSIKSALDALVKKGVDDILVIPLYPQHAMATTQTIEELTKKLVKNLYPYINLTFVPAFYHRKEYVDVLSNSIDSFIAEDAPDHLLFSYHGIPERHIKKTDITKSHCKIDANCCTQKSTAHEFCYRHQCFETTRQVAKQLNLKEGSYSSSFQSRLGFDPWLKPYTDKTIEEFAKKGIKKLAVVTPAFVSDCLETLEEIGMEAKEEFLEHGGEKFTLIPCLNDRDDWTTELAKWINNFGKE